MEKEMKKKKRIGILVHTPLSGLIYCEYSKPKNKRRK
jgi:hypothetical protein